MRAGAVAAALWALSLVGCTQGPKELGEGALPEIDPSQSQLVPSAKDEPVQSDVVLALPHPEEANGVEVSLLESLDGRHSVRDFSASPVSSEDLARLLWAGYGVRSDGGRTAPSAGGLYPGVLYVVAGNVEDVDAGIYRWDPFENVLRLVLAGDQREALMRAGLSQPSLGEAPLTLIYTADPEVLATKYGERAERYALMEAGHVSQNVLITAVSLDLGAVPMGAFEDEKLSHLLSLPTGLQPIYLIPIGHPAS